MIHWKEIRENYAKTIEDRVDKILDDTIERDKIDGKFQLPSGF